MDQSRVKGLSSDEILSESELAAITRRGMTRAYPRNTVVVAEGDNTDTLYIIVSGRVRIYVSNEQGKEVTLGEQGAGEYFGEMVLDEGPRSASAMTLEPCRFVVVSKNDVLAFLGENPLFAAYLIRKLIRRGRTLTEKVKSLALKDRHFNATSAVSRAFQS